MRPVSVVTGFLGSGKTTLLARALAAPSLQRTAVLVNEFGAVGLDHHLIRQVHEHVVLLRSGCICCVVQQDLVRALGDLLHLDESGTIEPLERVVVETSGLADPAPILFSVASDPMLQHHFAVDRVIATVDAVNGQAQLDRQIESARQVAVADTLVITKTDLAGAEATEALATRLRTINPSARLVSAVYGAVAPELLFGEETRRNLPAQPTIEVSQQERHAGDLRSLSLVFDQPLDWTAFGLWLSMLLHARGEQVLRVKGLLDVGKAGPVAVNGVQHIIHRPEHLLHWPDDDRRSRLVMITRAIEPEVICDSLRAFGLGDALQ